LRRHAANLCPEDGGKRPAPCHTGRVEDGRTTPRSAAGHSKRGSLPPHLTSLHFTPPHSTSSLLFHFHCHTTSTSTPLHLTSRAYVAVVLEGGEARALLARQPPDARGAGHAPVVRAAREQPPAPRERDTGLRRAAGWVGGHSSAR